MYTDWFYNRAMEAAKKEGCIMDLSTVLTKLSTAQPVTLASASPHAVTYAPNVDFYIEPQLTEINTNADSKLILFSAPGATGKSTLAKYIAGKRNAILWDLASERIANHSLSGMLVKAVGPRAFSDFTMGLATGESLLIIDALDEADMISGRDAVETLLLDLREYIQDAVVPTVLLCARSEIAHWVNQFYSSKEYYLSIDQYELGFFTLADAKQFVCTKIAQDYNPAPLASEYVDALFASIQEVLKLEHRITDFLGYAPVLEAIAKSYDPKGNTLHFVQRTQNTSNSTEVFVEIMLHILEREHEKVVNAFRVKCNTDHPKFTDWNSVYSVEEQLERIAWFIVAGEKTGTYVNNLPPELAGEYEECVQSFLSTHPFLKESKGRNPHLNFAGPAFRDYVLARLLLMKGFDEFVEGYLTNPLYHSCVPAQLFFDFYAYYSEGVASKRHFHYLYDAFKAKATASTVVSVTVDQEELGGELFCTFNSTRLPHSPEQVELIIPANPDVLCVSQLFNSYVDIEDDLGLGIRGGDVLLANSTIKCNRLRLYAPVVRVTADAGRETLVMCNTAMDLSGSPNVKFHVHAESPDCIKLVIPGIESWHTLREYEYQFGDESVVDSVKFENAVRRILRPYRKHKKDAPGKQWEYIENVAVGKSPFKQSVYHFFRDKGIIYQDDKDLSQSKLDISKLEELGINWTYLFQDSATMLKPALAAYSDWCASNSNG